MTPKDIEERLIDYSVLIIEITESLVKTKAGNYYAGQIIRSGSSPALNYGEAQDAESRKDFIHKIKIMLKELRETNIALKVIERANLSEKPDLARKVIVETNELISIFVKTVSTARRNS
jgi:four helix bundle protein